MIGGTVVLTREQTWQMRTSPVSNANETRGCTRLSESSLFAVTQLSRVERFLRNLDSGESSYRLFGQPPKLLLRKHHEKMPTLYQACHAARHGNP